MYANPVVLWISALVPAVILGAAAWSKLFDRRAFRTTVADYAVLPPILVTPVAGLVPYIELAAAAGLLIPGSRRTAAAAALVLFAVFTCALAINLLRGRRELDCGCHVGRAPVPLSGDLVLRNVLLMLWTSPAAASTGVGLSSLAWLDGFTIVAGSALGVMAYMMSGELLTLRRAKAAVTAKLADGRG
ncbi:MAG: MauE/DoxX family redox-associated membrane protein [Steroidobacteraceae bacterium]